MLQLSVRPGKSIRADLDARLCDGLLLANEGSVMV